MMRRAGGMAFLGLVLAATAACNLGGGGQQQDDGAPLTKADVHRTQMELSAKYDSAYEMVRQLTEQVMRLESRTVALENEMKLKDTELRSLNDKVARLQGAANDAPGGNLRPEEMHKLIETQLTRLKDGLRKEDVARTLAPIARFAAPRLCEALRSSLRDIEFMKRLEFVLSQMPPAELKIPLADSLKDQVARYPAARVVGDVGNYDLSRVLEPYTADGSLDFCFLAGDSLVRCKNKNGVPALLRVLRSEDQNLRLLASNTLARLNGERNMGYDFQKNGDQNAAAIKAWEEWYEKEGGKLFQ
jgi:hypothetical protein